MTESTERLREALEGLIAKWRHKIRSNVSAWDDAADELEAALKAANGGSDQRSTPQPGLPPKPSSAPAREKEEFE